MTHHTTNDSISIPKEQITGLILSGGKGTRMGGLDKGLVELKEQRLVERAVKRLQPQVSQLMISCNRNFPTYKELGHPIVVDAHFKECGPLSGIYNALLQCHTPYLAVVPVDSVAIPKNLVSKLSAKLHQSILCANPLEALQCTYAHDGNRSQPLFALLRTDLKDNLAHYLENGERRTHGWFKQQRAAIVDFSDQQSDFTNINDQETLKQINDSPPIPD